MAIAIVPHRNSPPALLLRETSRVGGQVTTRPLATLPHGKPERIEALRRVLRGDVDGLSGACEPVHDRLDGVLFALKQLAARLGLSQALGRGCMAKLALFLVLARVAHHGARLAAVQWAEDQGVADILSLPACDENHLYAALEWLAAQQERLANRLSRAYGQRTGSPPALVLSDVTSSYLAGDTHALAACGSTRDGTRGKRPIVIGLLPAADGAPVAISGCRGNTADPPTVFPPIDTLQRRFGVGEVVCVGDRGMVKATGKAALRAQGLRALTALTDAQVRKLITTRILPPELVAPPAQAVQHGPVRLVGRCHAAPRQRAAPRRADTLRRLTARVEERHAVVRQSPRTKPDAGLRSVTQWGKRPQLAACVGVSLDARKLRVTIAATARAEAAQRDGCLVLATAVSPDQLAAQTIDARYRDLPQVERPFRTMQTGL